MGRIHLVVPAALEAIVLVAAVQKRAMATQVVATDGVTQGSSVSGANTSSRSQAFGLEETQSLKVATVTITPSQDPGCIRRMMHGLIRSGTRSAFLVFSRMR